MTRRNSEGGNYYELGVSSPLLHAILHAAIIAAGVLGVMVGFGSDIYMSYGVSSAVFVIVYITSHSKLLTMALWLIEIAADKDFNDDGFIGNPDDEVEAEPEEVRHGTLDLRGTTIDGDRLPNSQVLGIEYPILKETTYAELFDHAKIRWSRQFLCRTASDKKANISQGEFSKLDNILKRAAIQGVKDNALTESGIAFFEKVIEQEQENA